MIKSEIVIVEDKTDEFSKFVKDACKMAIQKACFDTESQAKVNAPFKTGNLRASIGTDFTELNNLVGEVGSTADYALHIELGTARKAARPYLIPAADLVGEEMEKIVVALVDEFK